MKAKTCFKCHGEGTVTRVIKRGQPPQVVDCKVCAQKRLDLDFDNIPEIMRKELSNLHFGVIGAGLGGIALGIILKKIGCHVSIYEKDESFQCRKQGYGLTIQQGVSALKRLGIEISEETLSKSHYAFRPDGKILGFFGSTFSKYYLPSIQGVEDFSCLQDGPNIPKITGKFNGQGKYFFHVPRQHLRKMLLNKMLEPMAPIETVNEEVNSVKGAEDSLEMKWGYKLMDLTETGKGKINLSFEKDEQENVSTITKGTIVNEEVDFVIAGDGIYSSVRKLLVGDSLNYLGVVVVLGICAYDGELTSERVTETMDGTTRIFTMPFGVENGKMETDDLLKGKNATMWQLSFPVDSEDEAKKISVSTESLRKEALLRCSDWHDPLPELIRSTYPELMSGHPVYDRDELLPDNLENNLKHLKNKVIFVGDAGHPMSPFKGQGANQALLDALSFGEFFINALDTRKQKVVVSGKRKKDLGRRERRLLREKKEIEQQNGIEAQEESRNSPTESEQALSSMEQRSKETVIDITSQAVREYHIEMCKRSAPKIVGSREAAFLLHSIPPPSLFDSETTSCNRNDIKELYKKNAESFAENDVGRQLFDAGIDANSPWDLDKRVVEVCGHGSQPHLLHNRKIEISKLRQGD